MTLERIEAASSELGLHISWSKTKVQNIGAGQPALHLLINGQIVEGVQSFVYLAMAALLALRMALDPSSFVVLKSRLEI